MVHILLSTLASFVFFNSQTLRSFFFSSLSLLFLFFYQLDLFHPSQSSLVSLKSSPLFLIAKQCRQVPYVLIKASGRPRSTGRLFCH